MPFPFTFRRELTLYHMEHIANDRPIHHSGEGWTRDNLLQAAATLLGMAMLSGPPNERHSPENLLKLSRELADTHCSRNQQECLAAFRMCIDLVQRLDDGFGGTGDYDRSFKSVVKGVAVLDESQADMTAFVPIDPAEVEQAEARGEAGVETGTANKRGGEGDGSEAENDDDEIAKLLDDPNYWKQTGAEANADGPQYRDADDDGQRIIAAFKPLPVPISRVQVRIESGAKCEENANFSLYSS